MIRRIFSYSGKYRKYLVFAALCITAESIFELIIPLIMADIVDTGVANGDRSYIFQQGGWMCVCAVAALLLGIGSAQFSAIAGQGLGANLREAEDILSCHPYDQRCYEYSEQHLQRYAPCMPRSRHADRGHGSCFFH